MLRDTYGLDSRLYLIDYDCYGGVISGLMREEELRILRSLLSSSAKLP